MNSDYVTGDSINITWKTDMLCSEVHIELRAERKNIHNITTTSNNGEFIWKIPSSIKSNDKYQIFIRADDNSVWAYSDIFKISNKKIPSYNIHLILLTIVLISVCLIIRQKIRIQSARRISHILS
ncbi:MAG: GPI anchored serine-threonine rich family protein [Candidatus Lokiarchaeota archaeon]|nr:GPI anchored serine-threonine rich family protein [Candidatus Lokiarchaeota archaeon]